jgi:hypothetical protein
MKQLTKEQQEQAVEIINDLLGQIESPWANDISYIHSAKAFLQSTKPKIYVCQNVCGTFYYYSKFILNKEVINEKYIKSLTDAHRFDSIEEAQEFIKYETKTDSSLYILIG